MAPRDKEKPRKALEGLVPWGDNAPARLAQPGERLLQPHGQWVFRGVCGNIPTLFSHSCNPVIPLCMFSKKGPETPEMFHNESESRDDDHTEVPEGFPSVPCKS